MTKSDYQSLLDAACRLETLENRDGEMWRKAVWYVVAAVIGAFLGHVFTQIGF